MISTSPGQIVRFSALCVTIVALAATACKKPSTAPGTGKGDGINQVKGHVAGPNAQAAFGGAILLAPTDGSLEARSVIEQDGTFTLSTYQPPSSTTGVPGVPPGTYLVRVIAPSGAALSLKNEHMNIVQGKNNVEIEVVGK